MLVVNFSFVKASSPQLTFLAGTFITAGLKSGFLLADQSRLMIINTQHVSLDILDGTHAHNWLTQSHYICKSD